MNKEYSKHLINIFKDKDLQNRMTRRLAFLSNIYKRSEVRLFNEFCFCLLTPQTKARNAYKAINELSHKNLILEGSHSEIALILKKHVRFHNMKSTNIIMAREKYFEGSVFSLKTGIDNAHKNNSMTDFRNSLAKEVRGYGLKESSHFLRNIGFGQTLAILDRHILREMDKLNILPESLTPKSNLTKNNYLLCEANLIEYSKKSNIPAEYLDFVMWYEATNDIFK